MAPKCQICPHVWPLRKTREEVSTLIREAIELYIEELKKDGLPIPEPRSPELIGR